MRYPFRSVAGTPAQQPVNIGITMLSVPPVTPTVAAPAPTAPSITTVDLSVVATPAIAAAVIGGAALPLSIMLTNDGLTAVSGAKVTAAWLVNTALRTFGALTVTPSSGVVLGAFGKADLVAGAYVTTWPANGTIALAVNVTAISAFAESLITQVVPVVGVAELSPANNTSVVTAKGVAAPATVMWQDFFTPANQASTITTGVKDRGGGTIGFCGDNYAQAKIFGVFGTPDTCPPTSTCTGARWQIKIIGYDAAKTYTVSQDYSALSPPPATYAPTFVVTQSGSLLTLTTGYTLLGATVADGIASAGNAVFQVFENGISIGTVTLVLVMY